MSDGAVPNTIELLPPGENIVGRDGRGFKNSNPKKLVEAFSERGQPIPVDFNHATESFMGGDAPAAGWINSIQIADGGAITASVDWTPNGAQRIKDREFRFISPAFFTNSDSVIIEFSSVALTNNPNLDLKALNSANHQQRNAEMDKLLALLGLQTGATEDQIYNAAVALNSKATALAAELVTAKQASTPSLNEYVPRADYDVALNKIQTLSTEISEGKKSAHDQAVDLEINAAVKAGKITPATQDFYRANCNDAEGLKRFKEFCSSAPVIGGDETDLSTRDPDRGSAETNANVAHVAKMMGMTVAEMNEAASGTTEEVN